VAAGREGFGVTLAATPGAAALPESLPGPLWVARAVRQWGTRPQQPTSDGDPALELTEWPIGITAHCRCEAHAGDARGLGEAQERDLRNVAAVCRAQGRELLLEIATGVPAAARLDMLVGALARVYALDVRPD